MRREGERREVRMRREERGGEERGEEGQSVRGIAHDTQPIVTMVTMSESEALVTRST